MGYVLIRVHSFECDYPGCHPEEEHAEYRKRDAWTILDKAGWDIRGGMVHCPAHAAASIPNRQETP